MKKKKKKNYSKLNFVQEVWKTMEKQAASNPKVARLHERLSPDFEKISRLIPKLIGSNETAEESLIHEIHGYGTKAVLPLIDFILQFKKLKGS